MYLSIQKLNRVNEVNRAIYRFVDCEICYKQKVGQLQQFPKLYIPLDKSSRQLSSLSINTMFEQQQIYDSPQQPILKPQQANNANKRALIKKTLIEAFQTLCQSAPSHSALSTCHKIIGEHLKSPQILQIFFQLVIQFGDNNQTLTKLVITQIFTYMKRQSSFGYEQRHDKTKINLFFMQFFVESNVEFKFKKMLQNTYMQFLFVPQSNLFDKIDIKLREITVQYIDKKLTQIFTTTKTSYNAFEHYNKLHCPISIMIPSEEIINQHNVKTCSSLIHIIRCLFLGGNLETQLMKSILSNCLSVYYQVTLNAVKNILRAVEMKQEGPFGVYADECDQYMQILALMFSRLLADKFPQLRQRILHTREIYQLLVILLNVSPQFSSFQAVRNILAQNLYPQGKQPSFQTLSVHIQQQINSLNLQQTFFKSKIFPEPTDQKSKRIISNLISIKKNSIQILIKCVKTIGKKKTKMFNEYPYLSAVVTGLWLKFKDCLIIETEVYLKFIETMTKQAQLSQMKRLQQDLISTAIRLLSSAVKLPSMYPLVSPFQNTIIFRLCFPWLISRKEHDRFEAEDYLFFREDLINKQNMSYIENHVASLIEAYMDNIDGVVTGIMQNCTQLMTYHLTKTPQSLEALAPEFKTSWILEYYSAERQIQSALTLIAIQSYLSLQRNDITLTLQKFISSQKHFFLSIQNDFRITVQFLTMYSYYVDNFYSNAIQGISSQNFEYRQLHQQVLKYCCYLMKASYNYEKNQYNGRNGHILYFIALDCLSNSLNHSELVYVLYCHFPPKDELSIPHYMLPYQNYPFYPRKSLYTPPSNKKIPGEIKPGQMQSFLNPSQRKQKQQQSTQQQMRQLLMHYRKMGLNKDEYFEKDQLISIIQFLSQNLQSKANIKIIELLIEFNISFVRQQLKNQGTVVNIPCIFRQDTATQLTIKMYSLMHSKHQQFPNRGLFETKATELIYVLHTISIDAYYIYSLGMEIVWMIPNFWNFDPMEEDNNVDKLLKCTDLVVRLALKHYTSDKGVNVKDLMQKITANFTQYCFMYIKKIHKFNIIFGILLNLILLKVSPQKMFEFLYLLITQKLMKSQLKSDNDKSDNDQDTEQNLKNDEIPSLSATDLLSLSFYLFLTNMYRNPDCLNTQKNCQLLKVFHEYLTHYVSSHHIVTQLGDVFGKIFACCLCILEREFIKDTLKQFDLNIVEFFWRNLLYSGKIYKSELEMRIVAIKLLNIIREVIRRNDPEFPLQRLELMYQTACSCVFYSKNRDLLMIDDNDAGEDDFDHAGEQEDWQNEPITLNSNDAQIYVEDDVLLLKAVSRELLESQNMQKKQWVTKLIQNLPIAVRNFVKNKVINYQQQAKELGLRKIMKVKRPQGFTSNPTATTKQQIIKENTTLTKENGQNSDEQK